MGVVLTALRCAELPPFPDCLVLGCVVVSVHGPPLLRNQQKAQKPPLLALSSRLGFTQIAKVHMINLQRKAWANHKLLLNHTSPYKIFPFLFRDRPCRLQVQLAVVDDGTIAIEATVHELLAQWPYLSDLSLIWAAASIFEPASPADVAAANGDPAHQAAAAAAQRVLQEPAVQPWLYFNLIAHNSHIFAPVMDLVSKCVQPATAGALFPKALFSCLTCSAQGHASQHACHCCCLITRRLFSCLNSLTCSSTCALLTTCYNTAAQGTNPL